MSHGSNPPPSRPHSQKLDRAPITATGSIAADRDSGGNARDIRVIPGMQSGFPGRHFFAINRGFLISSRRDTAFRDGGLTNVTA